MPIQPSNIGRYIRNLRRRRGVSLREIAKIAELAPASISAIENGYSSPTLSTLHKLLMALGTDFVDFFSSPVEGKEQPVFLRHNMKVITDANREYMFPFPKRSDIRFESILETIFPTDKDVEWERLECDMAGIVLEGGPAIMEIRNEGSWTVNQGDAFYVREGLEHRAVDRGPAVLKLVTIYYPPRY
jgi:transcriptional regulator with XRE-family HTH domain